MSDGGSKPGSCYMEDRQLPMQYVPLSTSVMDPKEQQGHYSLAPAPPQDLPEGSCKQRRTALGAPTPDFSSMFTPEAFSMTGCSRKVAEVLNQSFLLLLAPTDDNASTLWCYVGR